MHVCLGSIHAVMLIKKEAHNQAFQDIMNARKLEIGAAYGQDNTQTCERGQKDLRKICNGRWSRAVDARYRLSDRSCGCASVGLGYEMRMVVRGTSSDICWFFRHFLKVRRDNLCSILYGRFPLEKFACFVARYTAQFDDEI